LGTIGLVAGKLARTQVINNGINPGSDFDHLALPHPPDSDSRSAKTEAGGIIRRAGIRGDGVAIDNDAGRFKRPGDKPAVGVFGAKIDQKQMFVGATTDKSKAMISQSFGERTGIGKGLMGIGGEIGSLGFLKGKGNTGNGMQMRAALEAGENGSVDTVEEIAASKNEGTARTAEGFVSSHSNNIGIAERRFVYISGDEAGFVRNIRKIIGTDSIGNAAHLGMAEFARISGAAGDQELGAEGFGLGEKRVIIQNLSIRIDMIKLDVPKLGNEGELFIFVLPAVAKMSAIIKTHGKDFVAGGKKSVVNGDVGFGAGMRLDVYPPGLGRKRKSLERFGSAERLDLIDDGVALVVAPLRIALGVLMHETAADSLVHFGIGVIFRRNEHKSLGLATALSMDKG